MKFFCALIIAVSGLLVAGRFLAQEDSSHVRTADAALPEAITVAATTNVPNSAPTTANLETALSAAPAETSAPTGPVTFPPVADKIDTGDFHHYEGCKLVRVDDDGVVISHRLGTAKLLFNVMPTDFQKTYGYDPEAAKKATADQEARNAASDAMVAQQNSVEAQQQAAAAPVQPALSGAGAPSTPVSKLSPGERDQIQHEIQRLQDDITYMQRDQQKLTDDRTHVKADGNGVSLGGYHDKIAQEQAQLRELQARLSQ